MFFEAVTLGPALLSLCDNAFNSIIGGRADEGFCKLLNNLKRIGKELEEPANHDIAKAITGAVLKSTIVACTAVLKEEYDIELSSFERATGLANLRGDPVVACVLRTIKFLKKELDYLEERKSFGEAVKNLSEDALLIIDPNHWNENSVSTEIQKIKNKVIERLKREHTIPFDPKIEEYINGGWPSGQKKIDWYELVSAIFTEDFKRNTRLRDIVLGKEALNQRYQSLNLLRELKSLKISFEEFENTTKNLVDSYLGIIEAIPKIMHKLDEIKGKLDKVLVGQERTLIGIEWIQQFLLEKFGSLTDKERMSLERKIDLEIAQNHKNIKLQSIQADLGARNNDYDLEDKRNEAITIVNQSLQLRNEAREEGANILAYKLLYFDISLFLSLFQDYFLELSNELHESEIAIWFDAVTHENGHLVFIFPKTEPARSDIYGLMEQFEASAKIIILSNTRFNQRLLDEFEAEGGLRLHQYTSFVTSFTELDIYLGKLTKDIQESDIASKNYVQLSCTEPIYNTNGIHLENKHHEAVNLFIRNWLEEDNGENFLTVLGDFGSGKTWLSQRMAYNRLKDFHESDKKGRIPILIQLKKYSDCNSVKDIVNGFCKDNALNLTFEAFEYLNKKGKLLLILDGFDEFKFNNSESPKEKFVMLSLLALPSSKIIITSRKNYFLDVTEEDLNTLDIPMPKDQIDQDSIPSFSTIFLKEFESEQVKERLRVKVPEDWENYWSKINEFNILPLAKRPVMLDIIIETMPELIGRKTVNKVDLYETYVKKWIYRAAKHRNKEGVKPLSIPEKELLVDVLAAKMYESDSFEVSSNDLSNEVSSNDLSKIAASNKLTHLLNSKLLEQELKTQSFLVRSDKGSFYFAHRSFLEFLISKKLVSDIKGNEEKLFRNKKISPEILDFMKDFNLDDSVLVNWLDDSRTEVDPKFLVGNIVSLLRARNYDFTNFDFSYLTINNGDFSGVDLTNSKFIGTGLDNVSFKDSILTNSDFTRARFVDLNLGVRSPAKAVEASDAHNLIFTCNGRNEIVVIDGKTFEKIAFLSGHSDSITSIYLSKYSKFLLSCSFDGTIHVWKLTKTLKKQIKFSLVKRIHVGNVTLYDVCMTPDLNYIISSDKYSRIKIWEFDTRKELTAKELTSLTQHDKEVYNIDIHPEGNHLASASFDTNAMLWSITFNSKEFIKEYIKLEDHKKEVNGISFSKDGTLLATSSNDTRIIIWDVRTKEKKFELRGHESIVWSVFFHPNNNYLVSGSSDKKVIVWDLDEQKPKVELLGHQNAVWNVCFFDEGRLVVSGGFDNTLKVWDWNRSECLKSIPLKENSDKKILEKYKGMILDHSIGLSEFQESHLLNMGAVKNRS